MADKKRKYEKPLHIDMPFEEAIERFAKTEPRDMKGKKPDLSNIDFSQYFYYPALLCTEGEHLGYQKLSDDDKDAIIPIFELSYRRGKPDLSSSSDLIRSSAGERPYILDLNKEPAPPAYVPKAGPTPETKKAQLVADKYNGLLSKLLDDEDGFEEWRKLVATFPNCIPVLQFEDPASQGREILRQCAKLAKGDRPVAIRIGPETPDAIFPIVGQLYAILDRPDQMLVIIDCGQGRIKRQSREEAGTHILSSIRKELPLQQRHLMRAVCMSASFPKSPKDDVNVYEAYEWPLWEAVREAGPVSFGDYAGAYRFPNTSFVPPDWRATVAYPTDAGWIVYRDPDANNPDGWVAGSKKVMDQDDYDGEDGTWGHLAIERAAKGDLSGLEQTRAWTAVKVNLHIHHQIGRAEYIVSNYGSEDEDEP